MEKLSERCMYYCGLLAVHGVPVDDMKHIQNLIDAEEQGLLLRFPCKVGETVWAITSPINLGFDEGETLEVYKCVVESISFYNNRKHQIRLYSGEVFVTWYVRVSDFGKQVFLTKEEAEQALAKMKEV